MKNAILCALCTALAAGCATKEQPAPITGTWKLLTGMTIQGKDTTITDYTTGQEMIKIISPTHFAFLRHDLNHGKDSSAVFVAGGGAVRIGDHTYTEQLHYCNFREWEGGTFDMEYTIKGDTLVTTGIEKVEAAGINHLNVETFVRVK